MPILLHQKADQAQALLAETDLDCWLIFVRETGIHPDPGVELVVGTDVVRNSAFLLGRDGTRTAIVATFDTAKVRELGVFPTVVGYDEDIRGPLLEALRRLDPGRIGLNYSSDDVTADGLTHGHWLLLAELLRETPFAERLCSAAPLLGRLRGRKLPEEVSRVQRAIGATERIVAEVTPFLRPGQSERDIADFVHDRFRERGLPCAWEVDSCPIVNSGPASDAGHTRPRSDLRVDPGHLVHLDLGVKVEGYCSDLQRMWYLLRPGETSPPQELQWACRTVVDAIEAAAAALRPGVRGRDVDAAARTVVAAAGYPDFKHAVGHSLGRAVHDGGTLLGPMWPCYGRSPDGIVEEGNVFTLELGVPTSAGLLGLEEDVLVTAGGCRFLSSFQRELLVV